MRGRMASGWRQGHLEKSPSFSQATSLHAPLGIWWARPRNDHEHAAGDEGNFHGTGVKFGEVDDYSDPISAYRILPSARVRHHRDA